MMSQHTAPLCHKHILLSLARPIRSTSCHYLWLVAVIQCDSERLATLHTTPDPSPSSRRRGRGGFCHVNTPAIWQIYSCFRPTEAEKPTINLIKYGFCLCEKPIRRCQRRSRNSGQVTSDPPALKKDKGGVSCVRRGGGGVV